MKLPRLNLLFSFAYVNQVDDMLSALLETTNVLIDSGAFTNHQAGLKGKPATATLPSYVEFCRKIDTRAWNYIALDVIGKKEKTRANLQAMLDAGLKPMPVFVYGEDYDRVGSLCEINGGRVCVAGGVSGHNYMRHRYQKVYRESGGKAKIHALGFVRCPDIFRLPLSTVDSASYYNGSVFGKVFRYDRTRGEWDCPSYRELRKKSAYQAILRDLARCGVTAGFMNNVDNTRKLCSWPSFFTLNSYLTFHEHASNAGPSYFFAIPGPSWILGLAAVVATRKGDHFNYPESRSIYERLNNLHKKSKSAAASEAARIFSENTRPKEPNGVEAYAARVAN